MAGESTAASLPETTNGNSIGARRLAGVKWPVRPDAEQPPVRWRELMAMVAMVVLCDLTIYRGQGFAGYAALFLAGPLLFAWGAFRPRMGKAVWMTGTMLMLLAAKMIWCGSVLLVAAGFSLLAAFVMALSGQTPFVAETAVFASQSIASGYRRLSQYGRSSGTSPLARVPLLNVGLPLLALVVFGTVFVLANPDLVSSFSEALEQISKRMREWLMKMSAGEIAFWFGITWIVTGLLRQASAANGVTEPAQAEATEPDALPVVSEPSRLYPAFRNTLATVIALFAAYLVFEFRTLWFREFPQGFYYSGYAHEGAAWLTFALALATAVLSLVFRGTVMRDPRLPRLHLLGWIWSAENFVLAIAVYHRLAIYINFNGMSPMRVVGLYGMTAVVAGFVHVL